MTTDKRTKEIKIRLTDEEHQQLQGFAGGQQLASWLRELGLSGGVSGQRKRPPVPVPTVAPELLRQVVAIGNNLNQIARRLNSAEWGPMDKLQVLAALAAISRDLEVLRDR